MSRDEELAWEVFMQGLDVTSGELVNGARKKCKNPLTTVRIRTYPKCGMWKDLTCDAFATQELSMDTRDPLYGLIMQYGT